MCPHLAVWAHCDWTIRSNSSELIVILRSSEGVNLLDVVLGLEIAFQGEKHFAEHIQRDGLDISGEGAVDVGSEPVVVGGAQDELLAGLGAVAQEATGGTDADEAIPTLVEDVELGEPDVVAAQNLLHLPDRVEPVGVAPALNSPGDIVGLGVVLQSGKHRKVMALPGFQQSPVVFVVVPVGPFAAKAVFHASHKSHSF